MLTVKSDRYPLLTTQCRKRLVEAIRAAHDSHAFAVQEDGGLYDLVEPSQVARLLSEGWQVYRVTLET